MFRKYRESLHKNNENDANKNLENTPNRLPFQQSVWPSRAPPCRRKRCRKRTYKPLYPASACFVYL